MLKTGFVSLYVLALLSFGSIAIEATDPYTGLQLQLFLHGLGLGVLLHTLYAHRSGVLDIGSHRQSRETGELMFKINLFLMVVLGLTLEGIGLLLLASSWYGTPRSGKLFGPCLTLLIGRSSTAHRRWVEVP